jgi:hypothetical protein
MRMEQIESKKPAMLMRFLGAALVPVFVVSGYLLIVGSRYNGTGHHDSTLAFVLAIFGGSWFILTYPARWIYRPLCLAIYAPLAWAVLFFYSRLFIFLVFHGGIG